MKNSNRNRIRDTGTVLAQWRFDDQAARAHTVAAKAWLTSQIDRLIILDGACMRTPIVLSAADARVVAGGLLAAADYLDGHSLHGPTS